MVFAISLIAVVAIYFERIFEAIVRNFLFGFDQNTDSATELSSAYITEITREGLYGELISFLIVAILITTIFSYVIARITLKPVRTALSSQKRFIGDIAHELRTPLSIIKTNIEVALLNKNINPEVEEMLHSNREELDRTSEIINNLLSFNKLVHPKKIHFKRVDMGDVIDTAVMALKELGVQKKVKIKIRKKSPRTVWGNSTALEQVALNLLKNAIAYTPPGGEIEVIAEPNNRGWLVFKVSDTGVGISRTDLAHIFEPFYRAERSRNRRVGSGSGLGLTIVNEIVKFHSGRISIKTALNKGTAVTILIPSSGHDNSK